MSAQTMLLVSGVSTRIGDLKRCTFLKIQLQTHNIIIPHFSYSCSPLPTLALLNSKPNNNKVTTCRYATGNEERETKLSQLLVPTLMTLLISLIPTGYMYTPSSHAIELVAGAALFKQSCIGCHDAGGNLIQPGATLFAKDLERNGADSEDEIYNITYNGKGRMPGFGEKCMPRGKCTFGPRLQDEDIKLLAQFVKSQADNGWPATQ